MLDSSLLPRIQTHLTRYEEIEMLLGDPQVASDQARYIKLTKEYKHLKSLKELMSAYEAEIDNIAFFNELIEMSTDMQEAEGARKEISNSEKKIEGLIDDIKLFLVPSDPEDDKNAILEIRGGTGGDEAALFAGDLAKMYIRFCESKGWNVAITSFSEGAAGGYKEIVMSITGDGV